MRRSLYLFALALSLASSACRHDLTICRDENDGPACRDSATDDSDAISGDAEPADANAYDGASESGFDAGEEVVSDGSDAVAAEGSTDAGSDSSDTGVMPDSTLSDVADTFVADTIVADTFVADTFVADTFVADTFVADTFVADTFLADTGPSCVTGSFACSGASGNDLHRCGDGGLGFVVTCPAGSCSASAGRCTSCTPGALTCAGADRRKCDTWGSGFVTIETCASAALCAASTGVACAAAVCAVGEKRCATGGIEVCNADRTGWNRITECSLACAGGACLTIADIGAMSVGNHVAALMSDGSVRCLGDLDAQGQCAAGEPFEIPKPAIVPAVIGAIQLAVGGDQTGVVLSTGGAMIWGGTPAAVPGLSGVVEISIGASHACARLSSGLIKCWGANSNAELGNGVGAAVAPPTFVAPSGLSSVAVLTMGPADSFALLTTGEAKGWGANGSGQLGFASPTVQSTPTTVFSGVTQVSPGVGFTCVRTGAGDVACAGANSEGQLGDGSTSPRSSPLLVTGVSSVKQVVTGRSHACALLNDGTVRCWGGNGEGQLGDGTGMPSLTPVTVSGLTNVKKLASTERAVCALLSDSLTVKCWGTGATGDGASVPRNAPVTVSW